jgi:hypothetical protein
MLDYEKKQQETAKETVKIITDGLNNGSLKAKFFIEEMKKEHRYLQGEFMNLIALYMENCAKEDYPYDARNKFNHTASKIMIDALYKR